VRAVLGGGGPNRLDDPRLIVARHGRLERQPDERVASLLDDRADATGKRPERRSATVRRPKRRLDATRSNYPDSRPMTAGE